MGTWTADTELQLIWDSVVADRYSLTMDDIRSLEEEVAVVWAAAGHNESVSCASPPNSPLPADRVTVPISAAAKFQRIVDDQSARSVEGQRASMICSSAVTAGPTQSWAIEQ